jgi:hypothetical protein
MLAVFMGVGLLILPQLAVEFLFGVVVGALVDPPALCDVLERIAWVLPRVVRQGYKEAKCVALDEIVLSRLLGIR